jgi:DNA-binding MarR family transcriptional regulator
MQPKESPEIEFLLKALTMVTARTEAILNVLEKKNLIISKEQVENDALSIFGKISEAQRELYVSALNLERGSVSPVL